MRFSASSIPTLRRAALLLSCGAAMLPALAHAQTPAAEGEGDNIAVTGRPISQSAEAIGEDKITNVVAVTRKAL